MSKGSRCAEGPSIVVEDELHVTVNSAIPLTSIRNVNRVKNEKSVDLPRNQNLFSVAPMLIWAFRVYGVDLSAPRRNCAFRTTVLLVLTIITASLQILLLAIFVGFIIFVVFNSGYLMVLYGTVPIVASGLSSFISFLNLKRKRKRIQRFFHTLFLSMKADFGISFPEIRSNIRRMQRRAVIGFSAAFVLQLMQRVLIMVSPVPNSELKRTMKNITFIFPVTSDQIRPYVWVMQCIFIHVQVFDILTVCLLVVACRLVLLPFERIRQRLDRHKFTCRRSGADEPTFGPSSSKEAEAGGDDVGSVGRQLVQSPAPAISVAEFYRLHRQACHLVMEIERIFSSFLLTWCGTQTLTVCFWIRSIKVNTIRSYIFSLSVMLHLACTATPFFIIAIIATKVNEQVLSILKEFTQSLLYDNDTCNGKQRKNMTNHILYVNYLAMHPVNLTGHGFFTISRGFILTVLGTIVTYTLVLYGID